jgi:branched-chain amino acid transport system substrate-binding protein
MRTSASILFVAAMLALTLPALTVTTAGAQTGPVKIGVPVPLSGGSAEAGLDILRAAQLAARQANANGGVLGRHVEIVSADDACDAQQGVTAAQKLVDAGVVAVAGGYCSSAALPESVVFHNAGVAFVADASTNPQLTEQGFHDVFRDIGRDDQQGPFAAAFMVNELHAHRIAVVHDNTVYAKGLAEATRMALEDKPDVKVVFFDAITPGEKDFTSTLTRIKSLRPDVLYFTGYYAEGGLLARQFKELRLPGAFMAGDANNDPTFIKEAGSAANGALITSAPLAQFLPTAKGFIATYRKTYGMAPGPYSSYEYDAVNIVLAAIRRAHSTDRGAIVSALAKTNDYRGVTGMITFNAKGDRAGITYMVLDIRHERFAAYYRAAA